ncbi:MAG: hypothetical protein QX190_05405 [Methylococcales bacterium]
MPAQNNIHLTPTHCMEFMYLATQRGALTLHFHAPRGNENNTSQVLTFNQKDAP